jgi:hypothetical protein
MRINQTLARLVAAFAVTILLNGGLLAAFDGVVARAELVRAGVQLVG